MSDGSARSDHTWSVLCTNPDFVGSQRRTDFGEFVHGTAEKISGGGMHKWQGAFSGRPEMMSDLMPIIRAKYSGASPRHTFTFLCALRSFWRFLDAYEKMCASKDTLIRIRRLRDITGPLLEIFSLPGPSDTWQAASKSSAKMIRSLVADAIFDADLPQLIVSSLPESTRSTKDTPTDEEGLSVIRHLRSEAHEIIRRWSRADRLASEGRNLLDLVRKAEVGATAFDFVPNEADAHATYRALVLLSGNPYPDLQQLNAALGLSPTCSCLPSWWPSHEPSMRDANKGRPIRLTELAAGLYPMVADVVTFQLLFLARTAWNPATAASIDYENWSSPYDSEHRWIFAPKSRANGTFQHGIAKTNFITGAYQLVERLIQRTASLRRWAAKNAESVLYPDLVAKSPWLGISPRSGQIYVANPTETQSLNKYLNLHIDRLNSMASDGVRVGRITASDFRDIAAAVMYRDSRYSSWVLMLMLGHSNLATAHRYGYRHAGRQESHRLMVQTVGDVFDQIESNRTWDPVLTRAKIEGIEITTEALERLVTYRQHRTYDGSLCTTPCHPPREIDPTNPLDGKSICAQQHRCVAASCPRRVVLNDSLPLLARRIAELEWNERNLGVVRFHVASDAHDLLTLRTTVRQWPEEEVNAHLNLWRSRIERGEHLPLLIGGLHR